MQEIGIESSILKDVLGGRKTIEGRLGKPRFIRLRVGDKLSLREDVWDKHKIVVSYHNRATIEVKQLLYFESFEDMLNSVDYRKVVPGAKKFTQALEAYTLFYTPKDEAEYGVVCITFELISAD